MENIIAQDTAFADFCQSWGLLPQMFKNKDRILADFGLPFLHYIVLHYSEVLRKARIFFRNVLLIWHVDKTAVFWKRLEDAAKFFFSGLISLGLALNVSSLRRIMLVSINSIKTSSIHRYIIASSR